MDTSLLGKVLAALAQGAAGHVGQQARTALAALATRTQISFTASQIR